MRLQAEDLAATSIRPYAYKQKPVTSFGNDIAVDTGVLIITATRLPLNSRGSERPTDKVL